MFAELLIRSCFSFLRGASKPQELMSEAARLGLKTVAQTDLDGLYGLVRGSRAAEEHGLSFIAGVELTLANEPNLPSGIAPMPEEGQALTLALFAQDVHGYQNICRLLTLGHEQQEKGSCVCEA